MPAESASDRRLSAQADRRIAVVGGLLLRAVTTRRLLPDVQRNLWARDAWMVSRIRMKIPVLTALALCLLTSNTLAFAERPDCNSATDDAALDACLGQQLKQADSVLAKLYASIDKEKHWGQFQTALFHDANRAWLDYRNGYCEFTATTYLGGTAEATAELHCELTQDQWRISTLRAHPNCYFDDPSRCPPVLQKALNLP